MTQKQIEDEQRERRVQRGVLSQVKGSMIRGKEEEKKHDKAQEELAKKEYLRMVQTNEQQQLEHEKQYKQFFADYDRGMQDRQKSHIQHVTSPGEAKSRQLQDWVRRNEELYAKKLRDKEEQLRQWRQAVLFPLDSWVECEQQLPVGEGADGRKGTGAGSLQAELSIAGSGKRQTCIRLKRLRPDR